MAGTAMVRTMELPRCDGGRGDRGGYRCRNTDGGVASEQRWSTPSGKLCSDIYCLTVDVVQFTQGGYYWLE